MTICKRCIALLCVVSLLFSYSGRSQSLRPLDLRQVRVDDAFWSPRLKTWSTETVYDVLDKLEGKYEPDRPDIIAEKARWGRTRNAFLNFDLVAQGKKDIGQHDGPPWYDGLVYETLRGAADLLMENPDSALARRIDGYVERIAAAQAADPDGYINTYTTLMRSRQRWGTNGGDDKWQHDIYNSGMLIEAAVHYYKATGKTRLLEVAVRLSNYICTVIGPAPKLNVIPGHGGPEECMLKLYQLFRDQPALKNKLGVAVHEQDYLAMAKFWVEERGNYGEADGSHARKSDSSYNQDHMPVLQQPSIEGHAVRATLLATGVTATAVETGDPAYRQTANRYWDNMIGKRMFITGGEGAIADGERFGADFFLPESAYLETCASIGAGFFSERMLELEADGRYMDEFERVAYNNFLSGVSLDGHRYFYENPLIANDHRRWQWHDCPCCPPMILKLAGALPQFIYAYDDDGVYVNLFIGSEAAITMKGSDLQLRQFTEYPWKGRTKIEVDPARAGEFAVHVRIPGWAQGKENPFGLYKGRVEGAATLKVNGKSIAVAPEKGYAVIRRTWKKGDIIELNLPVQPRLISPSDSIATLKGKMAIAAGPVIYGLEAIDNPALARLHIRPGTQLKVQYKAQLLNGVNVVSGVGVDDAGQSKSFTAIPFYALGNRQAGAAYQVWLPEKPR
ncbi:glycoside hydrolase family 127 protein [Flavitalea sp. BT771]|uniref:glycoside hydrolase family 127 protein n=1 Tax=Flavitalea sp. BT771 TaxID=3063329 RepID=UPI0026E259B5|nr:beta-L-arabinofuranosidase domain-containing protein [Flavitalea sp. BT771]MDO6435443.1 glycoside hydrolase family 127 protein [Flavitalea sp. BT771]MDV6224197.1 glycoside hydrolase family 127 protein [Flavitalea sp. BT771]